MRSHLTVKGIFRERMIKKTNKKNPKHAPFKPEASPENALWALFE